MQNCHINATKHTEHNPIFAYFFKTTPNIGLIQIHLSTSSCRRYWMSIIALQCGHFMEILFLCRKTEHTHTELFDECQQLLMLKYTKFFANSAWAIKFILRFAVLRVISVTFHTHASYIWKIIISAKLVILLRTKITHYSYFQCNHVHHQSITISYFNIFSSMWYTIQCGNRLQNKHIPSSIHCFTHINFQICHKWNL